jgi:multimeric flavodoxin WrbA
MKVIAFNGSPRKNWNTYTLLNEALKGAKSRGAEGELINLYDITYKGCISCFACKLKGKTVDQCVVKDELFPVLKKIRGKRCLHPGSLFISAVLLGQMRSLMERLCFPYISYDSYMIRNPPVLARKSIPLLFTP